MDPIVVAGLPVGVRGFILNANVALLLMVVVVLAAFGQVGGPVGSDRMHPSQGQKGMP